MNKAVNVFIYLFIHSIFLNLILLFYQIKINNKINKIFNKK